MCTHFVHTLQNVENKPNKLAFFSCNVFWTCYNGFVRKLSRRKERKAGEGSPKTTPAKQNMVVRVSEEYLDSNYDSKTEKAELEVAVHATVDAARTACGDLELEILNLGLQSMARKQLTEICRSKFPEKWYSPKAYQSCFESNRSKLEGKGYSGIKDLRNAFLDIAKKNPKVREQIAFLTAMEDVEI